MWNVSLWMSNVRCCFCEWKGGRPSFVDGRLKVCEWKGGRLSFVDGRLKVVCGISGHLLLVIEK